MPSKKDGVSDTSKEQLSLLIAGSPLSIGILSNENKRF